MIYITQLIYLKPGKEDIFDQFESVAIPIISKYNGRILFRMRPAATSMIESNIETPYEIHLVEFPSEIDFSHFMLDEERKRYLHMKEESIRESWLLKGERL